MTTLRRRTNSDREDEFRTVSATFQTFASAESLGNHTISSVMACRDRSGEFHSCIKRLDTSHSGSVNRKRDSKGLENWKNFMDCARQIGKDINQTLCKLEKLTLMARKKSLFDNPVEIKELTYIVKEDINNLSKQINQLGGMSKSKNYKHGKHMVNHSNSVVFSLQSKLASMSCSFKEVLEVRTENLKEEKVRREKFTNSYIPSSMPSALSQDSAGSVLLMDESAPGECSINMGMTNQQLQLVDEQDSYIQSRVDAMETIESTIVELSSIFQELSHMVEHQGELVTRIDSNVEDAQLNVEAAHSEILRYFGSVTSNRWLMIKIFAVLIIFFIIFVVFVA